MSVLGFLMLSNLWCRVNALVLYRTGALRRVFMAVFCFFPRGTLLHVYRRTKCHGSPWSGVQSGGHLEVWDVPVAKPKRGALCPGVDVMNDADWLTSSSPTLGPSVELDQGKPGATIVGLLFSHSRRSLRCLVITNLFIMGPVGVMWLGRFVPES